MSDDKRYFIGGPAHGQEVPEWFNGDSFVWPIPDKDSSGRMGENDKRVLYLRTTFCRFDQGWQREEYTFYVLQGFGFSNPRECELSMTHFSNKVTQCPSCGSSAAVPLSKEYTFEYRYNRMMPIGVVGYGAGISCIVDVISCDECDSVFMGEQAELVKKEAINNFRNSEKF